MRRHDHCRRYAHVQDPAGNPIANARLEASGDGNSSLMLAGFSANGSSAASNIYTNAAGDASLWLFPTCPGCSYSIIAYPPSGTPFATFTIHDVTVTSDKSIVIVLQFVHASPSTTATLSPTPGSDGIYPGDVTVTLSATAIAGQSVTTTRYSIDSGSEQTYTAPFVVSGDGTHTIRYWSIDNAGVYETPKTKTFQIASLRITTDSPLSSGTVGQAYSVVLHAAGGTPPYTWSVAAGGLPAGLSLNASTGEISGVPTTAGTFGFTVQVTDSSSNTSTKPFGLAPPPPSGSAGSEYTVPVHIDPAPSGGGGSNVSCTNYTVVSGPLPAGLTLDPTTGLVSGTPLNGGTYTFTIGCTVSGDPTSGQTATKDFTITIYNALPSVTSLDPTSATAGGPAFTLTVNGTNFVLDSVVHWNGADRTTTYVSATQLKAAIPATDITTNGTASVTVVNPDPGGGSSNAKSFNINSPNRPPTAQPNGPYSVPEGGSASLNGSGSDPDGDPLTYAWDLDNNGSFETTGQTPTFSAAGRDGPSDQTVTLQVCDNKSACATSSATVHIDNVAPTPSISGTPSSSPEGTLIRLSGAATDPSAADTAAGFSFAWSVTKNGNAYASGTGANLSFTPDDNGTYVATLSVTDKDGGTNTTSKTITAANVAPAGVNVQLSTATIDENDSATLSGSFTDPGTLDTHTVVISWGDGSPNTTLTLAANVLTFSATHQYLDDNPTGTPIDSNPISLTVTDKDRDNGSGSGSVTVKNVAPTITSVSATSLLVGPLAFGPSSVNGSISDLGTLDTHTVVINWGDGSPNTTLNLAANVLTFSTTHQYTSAGCKPISVTVIDDDTGSATTTSTASVGTSEFLAPMTNQPVTDKLRNNQVLPVKIRMTDCNGNLATNLTPAIRLVEGDQTPIADDGSDTITPPSVSAADTNGYMRLVDGAYIYNMKVSLAKLNTDYTIVIYPYANQTTGSLNPNVTLRHVIQATK